ncbi:hypothetical protein LSH36_57g08047 [Paralvinella palmiformis]|uniref:SHSP domain-containing protein n=1 Tax=Paralvinella palmiformis TaxID=53620 RepID=A0AAD9NDV9_9ANNE|nr:hypothetical protein LSH36_57g08047 [Paralvinella palmiformis]
MKKPNMKFERSVTQGASGSPVDGAVGGIEDEEFEQRKQQWQEELDEMSEFLYIKSTEEQREEGVRQLVDTAFVDDKDGLPILKAVFDVHHFKPDEINLTVDDDDTLILEAKSVDDRDDAVFRKTMVRKINLPIFVDHKMMHCQLSDDRRILTIEMPFHLPPQKKPEGANVVPIVDGPNGCRRICLGILVGPEFTPDDIKVETGGNRLEIIAGYREDVGRYGTSTSARQIRREYRLPETIEVESVRHAITPDGRLLVEILLKNEKPIRCEVTTEEIL